MVGGGLVIGYSIASLMGLAGFYIHDLHAQWRFPLGLGLVFLVFMLCILPLLLEAPRWLLMVGRDTEAKAIVFDIHKSPKDQRRTFAQREFFQMQQQVEIDRNMKSSWLEMFRRPSYRKRFIIALTFAFFNQSTGILVIGSYGTFIYKSLGFNARDALCFQVEWTLTAEPFTFLGTRLLLGFNRVGLANKSRQVRGSRIAGAESHCSL
jgi:MFS family permease